MSPNECQIFWTNLESIKNVMQLSDDEFSNSLGLTKSELNKFKIRGATPPLLSVFQIAEKYNFHLEDLLNSQFKLIFNKNNATSNSLNQRYTSGAYSKTRPITNILNYVEVNFGERAKINLLRKFQLNEDFISNPNSSVNIHLISDIALYLKDLYNFSNLDFFKMGQRTPYVASNQVITDKLSQYRKIKDMYVHFVEEMSPMFDYNYDYKIKSLNAVEMIIDSIPRSEVLDELEIRQSDFGNNQVCLTRMGVISSVPVARFGKDSFSRVTKVKSLYEGECTNTYRVVFNRP